MGKRRLAQTHMNKEEYRYVYSTLALPASMVGRINYCGYTLGTYLDFTLRRLHMTPLHSGIEILWSMSLGFGFYAILAAGAITLISGIIVLLRNLFS